VFQSIGWLEIFTLLIVALIVVGPERLPGLIEDVRAAIFAARRAINNAKKELNGEFGPEFDEFRKPLEQVAEYTRLGPRGALTKALFDGDDSALDDFDPQRLMREDPRDTPDARRRTPQPQPSQQQARQQNQPNPPQSPDDTPKGDYGAGGGFSWADIT
jgi:sec-independent protein translocase protein TatB